MLPWVDDVLQRIKGDYSESPPEHTQEEFTQEDMKYAKSMSVTDQFDTLGLKQEMLHKGSIKSVSSLGEILVIGWTSPPWNTWWRAIRLLVAKRGGGPVRILIFAHPKKRLLPQRNHPVKEEHINGGYAMRCDASSIVIYRKEEATRVLIHELLHASCSDPYHKETPHIEADTEAWAEIMLCGMAAHGSAASWRRLMREQINYSLRQAATLRDHHRVNTEADYAWRYTIGRLDVWRGLGLDVAEPPSHYTACESLRLTICEPENI